MRRRDNSLAMQMKAARRANQRLRTRKDLLAAAARLLRQGRDPAELDMDAVAAEAMVSRATAYRYFPSIQALLLEAPLEGQTPDPRQLFADEHSTDPVERIDKAEAALHEMCCRNERQLRLMLAASLQRCGAGQSAGRTNHNADGHFPIRQNRRTALIQAALQPARRRFSKPVYERLCAALALIFGTESMIVFRDVLGLKPATARQIKSWAVRALVRAALEESQNKSA
ncbi:TetR/AcrR family transcriptional regulator [Fontivita pretiosa]|uniref:TetR/AcrR family transcriptional regulator n=1 Tax=Fontivita pretiosa TaxID=2989684 RepID=UPI003D18712E